MKGHKEPGNKGLIWIMLHCCKYHNQKYNHYCIRLENQMHLRSVNHNLPKALQRAVKLHECRCNSWSVQANVMGGCHRHQALDSGEGYGAALSGAHEAAADAILAIVLRRRGEDAVGAEALHGSGHAVCEIKKAWLESRRARCTIQDWKVAPVWLAIQINNIFFIWHQMTRTVASGRLLVLLYFLIHDIQKQKDVIVKRAKFSSSVSVPSLCTTHTVSRSCLSCWRHLYLKQMTCDDICGPCLWIDTPVILVWVTNRSKSVHRGEVSLWDQHEECPVYLETVHGMRGLT